MTDDSIIVVAGCSRCGSSAMMHMLHTGGVPVYGNGYPAYEGARSDSLPENADWLRECAGKAIKVLDPHHFILPTGYTYRFIWMRRDPMHQAMSQVKFLRALGYLSVFVSDALIRSIRDDNARIPGWLLDRYDGATMFIVRFENMLKQPLVTAQAVANYLHKDMDTAAMADVIDRRGPECLDGLAELDKIRAAYGEQA